MEKQEYILSLKKEPPSIILLIIITAGLYLPQLLSGQTALDGPDKMDVTIQFMPGYSYVQEEYPSGYFPLWTPDMFFGMPLHGYAHSGTLSPLSTSIMVLFDYPDAATISIMVHTLIGALGCFLLLRILGTSRSSSVIGALVWSQSGILFNLINTLSNVHTFAWAPWFLFFLIKIHDRPKIRSLLFCVLFLSLMILSGDVEGTVYMLMASALILIFYFPQRSAGHLFQTSVLGILIVAIAFLVCQWTAIPVLELTGMSIRSSSSQLAVTLDPQVKSWYMYLPQLLAPFSYYEESRKTSGFNGGLTPFYQGMIPFLLLVSATTSIRNDKITKTWFLVITCLLGYLAFMGLEFAQPLTTHLPILSKLASRGRMVQEIQLLTIIIFTRQLDFVLLNWKKYSNKIILLLFILGIFVLATCNFTVSPFSRIIMTAVIIICGLYLFLMKSNLSKRQTAAIALLLVFSDVTVLAFCQVPRNDKSYYELDKETSKCLESADKNFRFLAFNRLFQDGPYKPNLNGAIVKATDLHSPIGFNRLPMHRSFEFLWLANPNILRDNNIIFTGEASSQKSMDISAMVNPDHITPNFLRLMGLSSVRYFVARDLSLKFSDKYPLLIPNALPGNIFENIQAGGNKIEGAGSTRKLTINTPVNIKFDTYIYEENTLAFNIISNSNGPVWLDVSVEGKKSLEKSSFKRAVKSDDTTKVKIPLDIFFQDEVNVAINIKGPPGFSATIKNLEILRPNMPIKRVATSDKCNLNEEDIYFYDKALPRSFIVHQVKVFSENTKIQKALLDPKNDLSSVVFLEKDDPSVQTLNALKIQGHKKMSQEKVILSHSPQQVKMKTYLGSPGYLFLNDAYCPGWRAFDGKDEVKILRANLAFRAVFLASGPHEVTMKYVPLSFQTGLWITITSLTALLIAGLGGKFRRVKPLT